MKIVILAAGEGVRMRPLTLTTPKPLLVYKGKTVLDHLFDSLPDEIDEAIISVKYLAEKIKDHCGDNFHGRKVSYVEGEKNGNAMGFLQAKQYFVPDERFAVSYADEIITRSEINDCLKEKYSWLCYRVSNPKEVGIALVDKNNYITDILEKPQNSPSNFAANGFMVTDSNIFKYKPNVHKNGEYYFSDLMRQFATDHKVRAIEGDINHCQLTSEEDLNRLNNK